jgi:hypothetical protein
MRLWSLHPRYLDARGLTAAWREALLARAVLAGQTRGYRRHPQLHRFLSCPAPVEAIACYLAALHIEAENRGYRFDRGKLAGETFSTPGLTVTDGQITFELEHLRAKLRERDPERLSLLPARARDARAHPMFTIVPGPVEAWERG